ncbi:hypothetical protein [Actinokineospora sp. NBRC 105648]|uniref:hypothetical protein n=1 Tax=Actinokineospora sp. NBRC 105648 TaxID=3032206 RepID=UPI0025564804|nr:hypothetical protein [Actinokineospora sp. NBRC 105648]
MRTILVGAVASAAVTTALMTGIAEAEPTGAYTATAGCASSGTAIPSGFSLYQNFAGIGACANCLAAAIDLESGGHYATLCKFRVSSEVGLYAKWIP